MSLMISSPHTHSGKSVQNTMLLVMLALAPATAFGLYLFGWPAINLFLATILGCLLFEAIGLKIMGKPVGKYLSDGSAILTGWLLAMSLPPSAPWWIGLLGAFLAIIIGKQVFGGIGQNLFNPAMVARVALLISFPLEMTTWMHPAPLLSANAPDFMQGLQITFGGWVPDGYTGATTLGHIRTETGQGHALSSLGDMASSSSMAMGWMGGSMGETSALLLLGGGLLLLWKRIISWHIPLSMIGTLLLLAGIMHAVNPEKFPGIEVHLLAGATLLGAFFIATDLVTSPVSPAGQLLFGAGCGLLVYVIRTWAGYPEGMAFAVLLMNALTPLIDHYLRPRIYGRDRKGQPLNYASGEGKS
ncbi:MAG: RnfABCDGE type electron transport complex subunit D [Gammaproteobacteria bacterium]|nr:RnfABCDGE type electron transport complex subunit D [Gammaproteobacteria bacterium]MBU1725589.1 RnfABCDGE type electron transport complex subunit D [Gammaproteobacteria bacterium]MBU2005466.1 RnfABCDGE type electron transport complex subunit D [Gammaproteobacteria bacterium]